MNANTIQLVIIASTAASLLLGLICIFVSKIARTESKRTAALVVSFEDEIKGASKDLDTLSARMASQARRIAWLETRVPQSSDRYTDGSGARAETASKRQHNRTTTPRSDALENRPRCRVDLFDPRRTEGRSRSDHRPEQGCRSLRGA